MPPRRRNAPIPPSAPASSTPRKRRRTLTPSRYTTAESTTPQKHSSASVLTPTPSKRRRRANNTPSATPIRTPKPTTESDSLDDEEIQKENDNNEPRIDRGEEAAGSGRTYFEAHKGAISTSNFTLASLSVPPPSELSTALQLFHVNNPLQSHIDRRASRFAKQHAKMEYILEAGHSLLLYGFGSKCIILDEFASYLSSSTDVVVVHGFNPTTSLRSILTQIATDVLNLRSFSKRSLLDYVDAIREAIDLKQQLQPRKEKHNRRNSSTTNNSLITANDEPSPPILSIVIHNIDGKSLRSPDTQFALSRLSSTKGIRFIASIDHVNASLLWDAPTYAEFQWFWLPLNTFTPYNSETFFTSRPLWRGGAERRVEGAVAMLNSLTERARNVFRELVVRQMHGDNNERNGVVNKTKFNDLFQAVKEQFIVSDAETLRNILTELKTHDLLQIQRRREDAAEVLWIPLPDSQLEDILNEIGLEA